MQSLLENFGENFCLLSSSECSRGLNLHLKFDWADDSLRTTRPYEECGSFRSYLYFRASHQNKSKKKTQDRKRLKTTLHKIIHDYVAIPLPPYFQQPIRMTRHSQPSPCAKFILLLIFISIYCPSSKMIVILYIYTK